MSKFENLKTGKSMLIFRGCKQHGRAWASGKSAAPQGLARISIALLTQLATQ
jgi:hypothetical protein